MDENKAAPLSPIGLDDVGMLNASGLSFYRNPNGFLAMKKDGQDFKRVKLTRVLPFSDPQRYVAVSDYEGNEIGIIKDVAGLSPENAELVQAELGARYYCPTISKVISIREKMGHFYFDVRIGEHKKVFAIRDITKSIKQLDENSIIISDVDGNRYLIPDIWAVDGKSRRKLEPYLY